jgi:RpiB/LacA/LacB family sugar-phosphate isomerase
MGWRSKYLFPGMFNRMIIGLGADHAGFELKEFLGKRITALGHIVVDLGAHAYDALDDYPDFAENVARAVVARTVDRGVLVCGSGVGASIAANKVVGVRAGICTDTYSAHQGVEHDDVNVLVLGSRITGVEVANEILASFLNAHFSGEERHRRRLDKVLDIERRSLLGQSDHPRHSMSSQSDPQQLFLDRFEVEVDAQVRDLAAQDFVARFWKKDTELWGGGERAKIISNALGWTDVVAKMQLRVEELETFAQEIRSAGFERIVLAGMGGSSLAPLVLATCLPIGEHGLPLTVLDSTDPETVLQIEREGPLDKTLFVVASKSGGTAEPTAFDAYFFDKVGNPANFVAITDPGSPFAISAEQRKFRKIFLNFADIGGRFSALSYFGLVPAALLGLDLRKLLARAQDVVDENGAGVPTSEAPAVVLGAAMGNLGVAGINKLTILTPEHLTPLGLWLEQLVAESTGKDQKGILPIADEESGPPSVYGEDRFFVVVRDTGRDCSFLDVRSFALRDACHPIATINLYDPYDIAAEFMRFEIATAVAGAILGINPFDQPNVQESKDVTKRLLHQLEQVGSLPTEAPGLVEGPLSAFGDAVGATVVDSLKQFFHESGPGSFAVIQAYLPETRALSEKLHHLQGTIRDELKIATASGYGPRFLHSTGQFHKGGPNTGFFLQLTGDHLEDAPIPGQKATWGQFIDAQARGDLETLKTHGRRTLRIHLGADRIAALDTLIQSVCEAFSHRAH